ncbi:MBL fold metallo-hydrolase [Allobranchiibius sp. CTAmp26]|uniref:MBL fold metallo-hydrolase n=1 Tax=Allobranchiibius sp. CTAmp26 TaxID=2815214 RepID=UPI0027DDD9EC|nr:MBL fold metallo-hydrolase [Allobranchiibius sp. CTAmp26]
MSEVVAQGDGVRVEKVTTSGAFELDGGSWDVENNVWLIGDDESVLIVDPGHESGPILAAVGGRRIAGIWCTHAHNDHIDAAAGIKQVQPDVRIALHPDDWPLWELTYPDQRFDDDLTDGDVRTVAGARIEVLHTPGHSPGACCFHLPELGVVLTGDTLFQGGPGATGRSFSSFPVIIDSIRDRLLTLPPQTRVLTGHGDATTIGDEAPHLQEWIDAGS